MGTQNLPLIGRFAWTIEEFERLFDVGFLPNDTKFELIEGEIVEKMTQRTTHSTALSLTQFALETAFGAGFYVRTQLPMVFGEHSKPEPDLAVVVGNPRDYLEAHPSTAVLVVEISDTTLVQDQQAKSSLYARAGIAEYWIVNLIDRALEVRRQPSPVHDALLGHAYRSTQILLPGESVSPLSSPEATVFVDELLP